ncbi:hypothetical protein M011DRAFT_469600 [Sporormia fimetaria CBS 119925]|uniref:Uncharacterized protein n=1 Tax=Sporormia fimetaria CBS 119925 TaxID=1340428 RepID=A0A6A6V4R0_9PLEO|nr:hypothetical protein M011DRAFT_469600 [Sporormia fimetaria CBS 119925]
MLDIHKDDAPPPKVQFTHSLLPSYIDPQNVTTKKKPFSIFNANPFSHTLELILPEEVYELVRARLETANDDAIPRPQYARVYMKLEDLLCGEFFIQYVKMGNIMMRSEGRTNVDNIFTLYEGVLRLELDRPTYERCGLQGSPMEDGGRKHQKARWVVEYDLRAPSMLHGKKGFSRLLWAAQNVLNGSLKWLFYDLSQEGKDAGTMDTKEPLSAHHPSLHTIVPDILGMGDVSTPELDISHLSSSYDEEASLALLEWLHLVSLDSPRIMASDRIDPFLARYEVPDLGSGSQTRNLVRVRYKGFIPPQFVRSVFLAVRKQGLKIAKDDHDGEGGTTNGEEKRWFAVSGKGFGRTGGGWYTVMQFAGRDTLAWEGL